MSSLFDDKRSVPMACTTGYAARIFDNLLSGEDYDDTTPVDHIGFLNFDALIAKLREELASRK